MSHIPTKYPLFSLRAKKISLQYSYLAYHRLEISWQIHIELGTLFHLSTGPLEIPEILVTLATFQQHSVNKRDANCPLPRTGALQYVSIYSSPWIGVPLRLLLQERQQFALIWRSRYYYVRLDEENHKIWIKNARFTDVITFVWRGRIFFIKKEIHRSQNGNSISPEKSLQFTPGPIYTVVTTARLIFNQLFICPDRSRSIFFLLSSSESIYVYEKLNNEPRSDDSPRSSMSRHKPSLWR